jgi:hypothetical protein
MLFGSAFAALRVNRNVVRWACLVPPNGLSAWTWGLSLLVDRMRGNAESMPVLYGWLEVQIPERLADATQSGITLVQTPNWWKSCDFFDTVRHQFEKEAVYSTKQETYYRVLAEKPRSSSVNCNRNSRRAAPNGGFGRGSHFCLAPSDHRPVRPSKLTAILTL